MTDFEARPRTKYPCDGSDGVTVHVEDYKINVFTLELYKKRTEQKKFCCWLTCPLFSKCKLDLWGEQNSIRDHAQDIFTELINDLSNGTGPFSPKEETFLEDLLTRLEGDDRFIPSERQMAYLEGLHERFIKQNKGM